MTTSAVSSSVTPPIPLDLSEKPINLTPNARTVLEKRYLRKGEDGKPAETIPEMFWRVAYHVALGDEEYATEPKQAGEWCTKRTWETAYEFYELLTSLKFFPNSPTFTGAGTPLSQYSACFVLPIEDDMGKINGGIFDTLRDAVLIQQTGGGNGFGFSRLRPKGALVKASMGEASGPVSFLKAYDAAFGACLQGGVRRGANMATLLVSHPNVREFIRCKAVEGEVSNFNISVCLTDAFMCAVEKGEQFPLIFDDKVYEWIDARELFREIVTYAHGNGEPGALFIDAANRTNPVPHLYELEATNPCVTGDTWIQTANGPLQVLDLLGKPFSAITDGEHYLSGNGFWRTGTKQVFKLTTQEGYVIRLTENHKLFKSNRLTRTTQETSWCEVSDLKAGDRIKLNNHRGVWWSGSGTFEEGYLMGLLMGDGNISHTAAQDGKGKSILSFWGDSGKVVAQNALKMIQDTMTTRSDLGVVEIAERDEYRIISNSMHALSSRYGMERGNKHINLLIEQTSYEFHRGFLRGFFDADGSVMGDQNKGVSVRLSQSHLGDLQAVQRMLLRLGIVSSIYENRRDAGMRSMPNGKGGYSDYHCSACHEIAIANDNLETFSRIVGFGEPTRAEKLSQKLSNYKRTMNKESFFVTVQSIEADGTEDVYDTSVNDVHAFDGNGFLSHNCGEQWLGPYESCTLGSINLAQHVKDDGSVNWKELERSVRTATHFLDNVVTVNNYVPAVPELKEAATKCRRIGLGIMGLADLLYKCTFSYTEEIGQSFASTIMEYVAFHCINKSVELARERGAFLAIKGSIYDPDDFRWTIPTLPIVVTHPKTDWEKLRDDIKAYGIRNCSQTTIAPTGTIATVAGTEGYGCEPVFALAYQRWMEDGDSRKLLHYSSPLFMKALEKAGISDIERQRIIEQVALSGSCQNVEGVPEHIRRVFVVTEDISPEAHVRMQAALQAYVSNSLSKTINMPESATVDDVADAYMLAWKLGCKGITVYRTGSRDKVVLETKQTAQAKEAPIVQHPAMPATIKPRPQQLHGTTHEVKTPLGNAFVTVNRNGTSGRNPFEVFVNVGKAGSDTAAVSEAIGRLISLVLRVPSPISEHERLMLVTEQLQGIGGSRSLGFGPNRVMSLPDGIARALIADMSGEPTETLEVASTPVLVGTLKADLCPACGNATLVNEEGCKKCYSCAHSEC